MPYGQPGQLGYNNSTEITVTKIIVEGPGEGIFVYLGTPALGNPPIAAISNSTTDPFGNTILPYIFQGSAAGAYVQIAGEAINLQSGTQGDAAGQIVEYAAGSLGLLSGEVGPGDTQAELFLQSEQAAGSGSPLVEITATLTVSGDVEAATTSMSALLAAINALSGAATSTNGLTNGQTSGTSATAGLTNGQITGTSGAQSTGTAHTHSAGSYAVTNGQHSHAAGTYAVTNGQHDHTLPVV